MSDCVTCGESRPVKVSEAASAAQSLVATLKNNSRATTGQIEARATECRECPSKVRKHGIDWCGKPFTITDQTCGCIVWAKIRVRGEACPQGKW